MKAEGAAEAFHADGPVIETHIFSRYTSIKMPLCDTF